MAFEDSHTLFVVRWLRRLQLEHLLEKWYKYQIEIFSEKVRHPKRKVYSRLYEFFALVAGEFPSREEELADAYDAELDDLEIEEKVEVSTS